MQLISKKIDVEFVKEAGIRRPVAFTWKGQRFEIQEILRLWEDHGFGFVPPPQRRWWQRRHRVYYQVQTTDGQRFEIYWDRGSKKKEWVLHKKF